MSMIVASIFVFSAQGLGQDLERSEKRVKLAEERSVVLTEGQFVSPIVFERVDIFVEESERPKLLYLLRSRSKKPIRSFSVCYQFATTFVPWGKCERGGVQHL